VVNGVLPTVPGYSPCRSSERALLPGAVPRGSARVLIRISGVHHARELGISLGFPSKWLLRLIQYLIPDRRARSSLMAERAYPTLRAFGIIAVILPNAPRASLIFGCLLGLRRRIRLKFCEALSLPVVSRGLLTLDQCLMGSRPCSNRSEKDQANRHRRIKQGLECDC
jgi:hypothetical protein